MVYWLSVFLLRMIARVYFRGNVFECQTIPVTGAYIGIINHQSHLDVLALTMVVNRRFHTMAKHTLFSIPVVKWWLRAVHMFPVRREASDHRAFVHAFWLLRAGEVLFARRDTASPWAAGTATGAQRICAPGPPGWVSGGSCGNLGYGAGAATQGALPEAGESGGHGGRAYDSAPAALWS